MADQGARVAAPQRILRSKVAVPLPSTYAVPRTRLLARLRSATAARLVFLVAPAGWGKSTLLASWASDPEEERPFAWVQLDANDDDPARLWGHVVAALDHCCPEVVREAAALLHAPGLSPVEGAVPALLNAAADLPVQHVLVLDDAHLLGDEALETLEFFVAHLPSTLQLVVASRGDLDLPLARWRARGELVELRADDLRLSPAEAVPLLDDVAQQPIDPSLAAELTTRTEGWPAGLYLAGLSLRGSDDPVGRVRAFTGTQRHVVDYLGEEVLAALDADTRAFLVHTSVLDRFSSPLCDAVLDTTGSQQRLEALERANLFVVPLDDRRGWYRYHHLFQDLLRHELAQTTTDDIVSRLHRRAADWHAATGNVDAAIHHLRSAGDDGAAAVLVGQRIGPGLDGGEVGQVLRWIAAVPANAFAGDVHACLSAAYVASHAHRLDAARQFLALAEVADGESQVAGFASREAAMAMIRAHLLAHEPGRDVDAALEQARRAADLSPDPSLPGFTVSRSFLGALHLWRGELSLARSPLDAAWRLGRAAAAFSWALATGAYGVVLLGLGRDDEAAHVATEVVGAGAQPGSRRPEHYLSELVLGRVRSRHGAFDEAIGRLDVAAELARFWGQTEPLVLALAWGAEAAQRRGAGDRARSLLTEAYDVVDEEGPLPYPVRVLEETAVWSRLVLRRRVARHGPLVEELTDRELELLQLLPTGLPLRTIAQRLYLSLNTVKGYAKTLYRKLDVSSRDDAIAVGTQLGLLAPARPQPSG